MKHENSGPVVERAPLKDPAELPDAQNHWFLARSLSRFDRHRFRPSLYEERLLLIDALTASEALEKASQEVKKYPLKGMKNLGIFDLAQATPGLDEAKGHELVHFTHRSSEKLNVFVSKRFDLHPWHTRRGPHADHQATPALTTSSYNHGVVVVRSLHHSNHLRFASRRAVYFWVERFTAYNTENFDQALEWAEADSKLYDEALGLQTLSLWEAFLPFEPLEDGAEVFSILRQSRKSPRRFRNQITRRDTI